MPSLSVSPAPGGPAIGGVLTALSFEHELLALKCELDVRGIGYRIEHAAIDTADDVSEQASVVLGLGGVRASNGEHACKPAQYRDQTAGRLRELARSIQKVINQAHSCTPATNGRVA